MFSKYRVMYYRSYINKYMNECIKIWIYTLGSFNDRKTERYDGIICVLRTCILLSYLITNTVICAGVIRHWDNRPNITEMVSSSDTFYS